jgi:hypothetical protein
MLEITTCKFERIDFDPIEDRVLRIVDLLLCRMFHEQRSITADTRVARDLVCEVRGSQTVARPFGIVQNVRIVQLITCRRTRLRYY